MERALETVVANILEPTVASSFSREFNELVRSIADSRTRLEEERIMQGERTRLKAKMSQPSVSTKQMREYLVRLMYLEMLGIDGSFGYIHAVNMAQKGQNPMEKRVGYLAVSLFLHEDHELTILLVQTILRDLKSPNYLDVCSAMTALCRLLNADLAPAVYPAVVDKLTHGKDIVRKKALMCVLRFYKKVPSIVAPLMDELRKALGDPNPSVMGAALTVYLEIITDAPAPYRDLVPLFVALLRTIVERRPTLRAYEYHDVPAPWFQIKLLKILALLGADNRAASEGMYPILFDTLKRAEAGVDAAYAVLYEAIVTITTIYPNTQLVGAAAVTISHFLRATNNNLKYLGMTALAAIVKVDASHAAAHQMVVIDCLENSDETLRRKTLEVLYRMTNGQNVTVIVSKMLEFLRNTVDEYLRNELVTRVTMLAQKFAPNNLWYTRTMANVLDIGADLVPPETADALMRLIAEGNDDADEDRELRTECVGMFLGALERRSASEPLLHTAVWVLGEYGSLASSAGGVPGVLERLVDVFTRGHLSPDARGWLLSAMMKLVAQLGHCPSPVAALVQRCKGVAASDVAQRAAEFDALLADVSLMRAVLPADAACEDIEVDEGLSFADAFVNDALRRGAKKFLPPSKRVRRETRAQADEARTGIRFEAYEAPQPFIFTQAGAATGGAAPTPSAPEAPVVIPQQQMQTQQPATIASLAAAVPEAKRKWGKEGNMQRAGAAAVEAAPLPTTPSAPPAAVASPVMSASVAPAPQAAAAPPAPRVLTEKERMAAALFSGIVPGGSAAPPPVQRPATKSASAGTSALPRSTSSSVAAAAVVTHTPPVTHTLPVAPAPAPAPAPRRETDTLLVGFEDLSSSLPSTRPAAAAAPQRTPTASLLDDLSFLDLSPSATSAVAPSSSSSRNAPASSFDLLTASAPPATSHVTLEIIRPLMMATAEFGRRWVALKEEAKMSVRMTGGAPATPRGVADKIASRAKLHVVEVIKNEVILAGTQSPNYVALVHARVDAQGNVSYAVRSDAKQAAESVARIVSNAISS